MGIGNCFGRKVNGGKVESCGSINYKNGRLPLGKDEVQRIWEDYFEYLCNIDTEEQLAVHMCSFNGVQRGNYFRKGADQ